MLNKPLFVHTRSKYRRICSNYRRRPVEECVLVEQFVQRGQGITRHAGCEHAMGTRREINTGSLCRGNERFSK